MTMLTPPQPDEPALDLPALRASLAGKSGPRFWRSLEELAETPEFLTFLHREFPVGASEWSDVASRRTFLKLMGASLALAGVSGCTSEPAEKIVPYVRMPEQLVPGKPLYYATIVPIAGTGYATGVVVESHMGRPTMLEGNEKHPDSLGAVDPMIQSTMLTLYDPDRSQVVKRRGEISTWDKFTLAASNALDARRDVQGAGVRILTETITSPTLARQLRGLLKDFPQAQWHQYEPGGGGNVRAGAKLAFGEDVAVRYHVDKADVILALDADFMTVGPGHLCYAREFAAGREPQNGKMNRLYAVEPSPTVTGTMADHRLAITSQQVGALAGVLARKLGVHTVGGLPAATPEALAKHEPWIDALARDLQAHQGKCLIVAGETQPPSVHALAHAINGHLGNVGATLRYLEPVEAQPVDQAESLRALARDLDAGKVKLLLILGGNPAYNAPADLNFAAAVRKAALSAHLSLYDDETSSACHWQLPEAHTLEAWGDARAFDGRASIQQPLIAPLYGGRSALEVLAELLKSEDRTGYELVRAHWKDALYLGDFEVFWRTSVHDGFITSSAAKEKKVALKWENFEFPHEGQGLELTFRLDPTIHDGRYANNGWLQELPKPLSKLTWDNAAHISPRTAARLGLATGQVVELRHGKRTVDAPVWIQPGQADDAVTIHLGYGRTRAGRVGNGAGFNAYALRTSDAAWSASGLTLRATGQTYPLASSQYHRSVEWMKEESAEEAKRDLLKVITLDDVLHPHAEAKGHGHEHHPAPGDSLYPNYKYDGYAWGMVVNLNACNGCSACVTACQAENNIPVVGKDQVANGREMQWIDVDRYFHGDFDNPEVYHQPRLCMHCENAPCEVVCPVAATVHDSEGLNNMIYNRCVGTRYCANNCPYKVRHFNFYQYADQRTPSLALLNNPDVTVRARGVMEKCTYCVQRINEVRYAAEIQERKIRDGEIVTACQAACPTRAIVFGDLNDKESRVSKLKADARNYGMLEELNTRPRTTYLAKVTNPNPEIKAESHDGV